MATSVTRSEEKNGADSETGKLPAITVPKGGGAIRGIDEKFQVNPATGTASLSVPLYTSPARQGVHPQLSFSYDSGAGNGAFGVGWTLSVPRVARKTDRGIPYYQDHEESDTFVLSGAEDLVPCLKESEDDWVVDDVSRVIADGPELSPARMTCGATVRESKDCSPVSNVGRIPPQA